MKFIKAEKIDIKCIICDSNIIYQTNYKVSNYPIKKYVCHSCCANTNNETSSLVVELSIYNRCEINLPSLVRSNVYNSFIIGSCRKNVNTIHNFNNINIETNFNNIQKVYPEFTPNGFYKVLSLIDGQYMEIIGFEKLNVPIILDYDLFDEISKLIEQYIKIL